MPLPKPRQNEKEQEFVARCMADETMNKDFENEKQRFAVCQAQWDNKDKKAMRNYSHIANKIYNEKWCILPAFHARIVKDFEAYIRGDFKVDNIEEAAYRAIEYKLATPLGMPMDEDEDDKDEEDDMPHNATAIIDISGPTGVHLGLLDLCYGGTDLLTVRDQIEDAMEDPAVSRVILAINSPGGTVQGTAPFAEFLAEAKKKKCIYTFCQSGMVCSAAYWIASQTDGIFCTADSIIGSVGCYSMYLDATEAYRNAGLKPNVIVSEGSPYKVSGADFKEMTETERQMFQAEVNQVYNEFVAAVLLNRKIDAELLSGKVFTGAEAVQNGYADGIVNTMDEMVELLDNFDKE